MKKKFMDCWNLLPLEKIDGAMVMFIPYGVFDIKKWGRALCGFI